MPLGFVWTKKHGEPSVRLWWCWIEANLSFMSIVMAGKKCGIAMISFVALMLVLGSSRLVRVEQRQLSFHHNCRDLNPNSD